MFGKRISSLLGKVTVFFVICCCSLSAQAKYGGGIGTSDYPYLIYDANQMNEIGLHKEDWDKHFKLMADIDLSRFTGAAFNIIPIFTGVFDGNGHTISKFSYTSTDKWEIGLFRLVSGANSEIKNLGLIAPDVDVGTGMYVGSLVGCLGNGAITNCCVEGGSVKGDESVGGLVGDNWEGTIVNCYSTGSVSGDYYVGGLVGGNWEGTIVNCYSTGSVSGNRYVGGLVGYNEGIVSECFWDIETSGQTTSAGGTGLITAEMQMSITFVCWGYEPIWTIDDGVDYPRLWWENKLGELITKPSYGGGSGEPSTPYLIYTAEQLNTIGLIPCDWDKHFKLMADIDLRGFTGTNFNIIVRFTGTFDGNGHTVSNFSYTSTGINHIGLFRYLRDPTAKIKDLGLIDPNVDVGTGRYIASLVGYLGEGTITGCYVEGGRVSGDGGVGGLVGYNDSGTVTYCHSVGIVSGNTQTGGLVGDNSGKISDCYSKGSVEGDFDVGGLVGRNYRGTIFNCYATGSVSRERNVGGLVGANVFGAISNCYYSTGNISGESFVGGLVGYNDGPVSNCCAEANITGTYEVGGLVGTNGDPIKNCYATGSVKGNNCIGGLVGLTWGTITNSYSTASVMGNYDIGGLVGCCSAKVFASFWDIETSGQPPISRCGTGLPTAEMQKASTFIAWACDPVWTIDEGNDYPRLWWESMPGEDITPQLWLRTGSGTGDDPYLIYTAEQLNIVGLFLCEWDKHFKLMADIDLRDFTGTAFNIIGNDTAPFTGVFEGNGYTISNLSYTTDDRDNIGLFGYVDGPNAKIKNLGIIGFNIDAGTGDYVGLLVGDLRAGTVTTCYVKGGNVSGDGGIGGLVGYNFGTITNSYSEVCVSGNNRVGGLVGELNQGGAIIHCYSTGIVEGTTDVGGFVGWNNGSVTTSFWDVNTSGQTTSDGGIGKTTAEMMMAYTFIEWICEYVWMIDEGVDYPRLVWENMPGEIMSVPSDLYGGGTGEPNDPYLIYTVEQLNTIGLIECIWDKHFKLLADIDLIEFTGTSFNIIGMNYYNPFTGVFDGNGHTISKFTYSSTGTNYIGLFGYVSGENAEIKDLGLFDPNVYAGTGSYDVGALVGRLRGGAITNCYIERGSITGDSVVGGLVGLNDGTVTNSYSTAIILSFDWSVGGLVGCNLGQIKSCYSNGSITGLYVVGGLVGDNEGTITNCYSTGGVSGQSTVGGLSGFNWGTINDCYADPCVSGIESVGGLVGLNFVDGTTTNCYSSGSVSGDWLVGGLVGENIGTITNCYSAGSVSGDTDVGGLVGIGSPFYVSNSFWDIETSGQPSSAGGIGLPTDEMQMMSTFTDAGWDFVGETVNGIEDIWFIPQQDYPRLWWEGMKVPMKMTPVSLNCRSEGNWVKAHITLPEGFTVADVDSDMPVVLHSVGFQSLPVYVFVNKDKLVEIEAAFERQAVCSLAGDWPQELTVAGFLSDGNIFLGTSNIRIIHPGMKAIEELANCWLQGDCAHPDFCDGIDMNRDSLVNLLDYALLMNINVEFVTNE